MNDYEFIKDIEQKSNSDLNFIITKKKMNFGDKGTRLLTEIKIRPLLIEEINKRAKINFNTQENIYFKDSFSVPKEFKFFNRIFSLYFIKQNSTAIQNNQNIINYNLSNNTNMNNIYILNPQNPHNIPNNNINNLNLNNQNVQQNYQINKYTANNLISKTNNNINQINIGNQINNSNALININNVNGQNNQNLSYNTIGNLKNSVNTAQINNQMDLIENQKNIIDNAEIKNETEKKLEGRNNNIQKEENHPNIKKLNYIFSKRGLINIGSTCYMNATLQCLLHVSELVIYFLQEYEKDKLILNEKNKNIESKGKISEAFFNLVKGVNEESYNNNPYDKAFAPVEFKNVIGNYNPQFRRFEANDSKDLILYLLQTMHDEMNYYGDINKRLNYNPNQYNLYETYNHFMTNYNT